MRDVVDSPRAAMTAPTEVVDTSADDLFERVLRVDRQAAYAILCPSIDCSPACIVVKRRPDLETDSGRASAHYVLEISEKGGDRKSLIFVKHSINRRYEGRHYAALKDRSDVPTYYGEMFDPGGREVLFIEFVPKRISFEQGSCVVNALKVLSRVNSADLAHIYDPASARDSLVDRTFEWESSLQAIRDELTAARDGSAWTTRVDDEIDRLSKLLDRVRRDLETMAYCPDHHDPHPFNFGVRPDTGETVMFDLYSFGNQPRFYGAGNLIVSAARFRPTSSWMQQLSDIYLRSFCRASGTEVTRDEFRKDCIVGLSVLRFARLARLVKRSRKVATTDSLIDGRERRYIDELLRLGGHQ